MIKGFEDKETEKIFHREYSNKLPKSIQKRAYRKLVILDAAVKLKDLRAPSGNRLKKLSGKRKNQHSIRISNQWRICFVWKNGDTHNVYITDYH